MTQTFFLGQVRLFLVGLIAYAGGKGWLTPTDAGLATMLMSTLGPLLAPWAWSIYANVNQKLVPKDSIAIAPDTPITGSPVIGNHIRVDGVNDRDAGIAKVVGALLLALILSSLAFDPATAQQPARPPARAAVAPSPASTPGPCNIQTLFTGLSPLNFIDRLKACGSADFQSALDDAESSPVDNGALACLIPATALVKAIEASQNGNGGLISAFQKFRRAKQSGIVGACTAYVNSTILLQ